MNLSSYSVLLIVSGSIAACKIPDILRSLKTAGINIRCVLTQGGSKFITPTTLQTLSDSPVFMELFPTADTESPLQHITLARWADLILICPASANFLARIANGLADDLASTLLLATTTPVLAAPAMNPHMWEHPATQHNIATLTERGVTILPPVYGTLACGESGFGRMPEPQNIVDAVLAFFRTKRQKTGPLADVKVLVTAGPTHESLDPVRYLTNRSSGKQGYAIAEAFADQGALVTLISGPVALPPPAGIHTVICETARQMHHTVMTMRPYDIAVCTAAVADWRPEIEKTQKIKKNEKIEIPTCSANSCHSLTLVANPDILAELSQPSSLRPKLVIGFAAETENLIPHAQAKLRRKGCDWLIANDVSLSHHVMGGDHNKIFLLSHNQAGECQVEEWQTLPKTEIARRLVQRVIMSHQKNSVK